MTLTDPAGLVETRAAKLCCADLYASDWASVLLGESFHPGGQQLTERLGLLLGLGPESQVLDVAAGRGTSAIFLARRFGCRVMGVDYSARNVARAEAAVSGEGLSDRVTFLHGDAERLDLFTDGAFDAVICECALCTFPDKPAAAAEMARVLRSGGRVGLTDVTRRGSLPSELRTLLAWVACIADAQPVEGYAALLQEAGLISEVSQTHDEALVELVSTLFSKLVGAELLVRVGQLELPDVDFAQVKALARSALRAVEAGTLGYSLLIARKPDA